MPHKIKQVGIICSINLKSTVCKTFLMRNKLLIAPLNPFTFYLLHCGQHYLPSPNTSQLRLMTRER